jgi:peptidoglycan hydrolase-like protein with peptidoglycan-binding domain
MTTWKLTTAAVLAGLLLSTSAFAGAARKPGMVKGGDEEVKAAQQALKDKGLDPGTVDGRMGPKTQAALREFQKAQGMEATGQLDTKTIQTLGMDGKSSASPATTRDTKTADKNN